MENKGLIQMFKFSRSNTLVGLKATNEEQAKVVPEGFSNSIIWNLGHIYWAIEHVLAFAEGKEAEVPEGYYGLFKFGTSPATWESVPPSLEEIESKLLEQKERIPSKYGKKLDDKLKEPMRMNEETTFETFADVLNFLIWHEGTHLGTINGIKRTLGIKELWKPLETQKSK